MIISKQELANILKADKEQYIPKSFFEKFFFMITKNELIMLYRYLRIARYQAYYSNNRKRLINKILYTYYSRQKNIYQMKLGIDLNGNSFGAGVKIFHSCGIVVNKHSQIGDNCILRGNNCIGNNGKDKECPDIGNNVDIGVGAKVIGRIHIANDIVIGANAVVTKSFDEEGIIIAGIPAKKIGIRNKEYKDI